MASLCARGIITPALALMQPFSAKSIRRNKFLNISHASSPRPRMLNRKLEEVFSLLCTLDNSNIANITIRHCNFESALM